MAKYNMSEMIEASTAIKCWASDNIDTINEKIKSLDNMVDDTSESELLNNIKDYASCNISVMNSAVSGFESLHDGIDNAVKAYNRDVGQDVDNEELTGKINDNNQKIDEINDQIESLNPLNNYAFDPNPLDKYYGPEGTGLLKFTLENAKSSLEKLNKTYESLLEKFNNWNREHRNDLETAINAISEANTYIKQLSTISYDSTTGYDLKEELKEGISFLQVKIVNKFLLENDYITEKGKITKKGFKYLEVNFKRNYKDLSPQDKEKMLQIMSYADSENEFLSLISAGYSKPVQGGSYYSPTKTFKILSFEVGDELYKMNKCGIISGGNYDYYNRIATNHAIIDLLSKGPLLSRAIKNTDSKKYNKETSNSLKFKTTKKDNLNLICGISFHNKLYDTRYSTSAIQIETTFYLEGTVEKNDAYIKALNNAKDRADQEFSATITMDLITIATAGASKEIKSIVKGFEGAKKAGEATKYLLKYYNELSNYLGDKNLAKNSEALKALNKTYNLCGGDNQNNSEISNIITLHNKDKIGEAMNNFSLVASIDENNNTAYVSITPGTKEKVDNFNIEIDKINGSSLEDRKTFYWYLHSYDDSKSYEEMCDVMFPNGEPKKESDMITLEHIKVDYISSNVLDAEGKLEINRAYDACFRKNE